MSTDAQTTSKRLLIACIGNIFLGDDAFGIEVAQQLDTRRYPSGVQVIDFGIRGMDLAYTLLDPYDMLILVDAVPRGQAPGTLYLLDPTIPTAQGNALDAHGMDPVKVLAFAQQLGATIPRTLLVGCEPTPLPATDDPNEIPLGLSQPVYAVIPQAVTMIDQLVHTFISSTNPSIFKVG